ncbi:MAG: low molecular weight phosphotyrosine protein phosphatase [Clostridia bacterium]|nr:low molecular weight phosphotyrosine protein phosphatase [Clostridia bacterium]
MYRIMFVCLGNICRSAMAECIMTDIVKRRGLDSAFYIDSAGTSSEEDGNGIYPAAARKLKEMGVPLLSHRAKQLTRDDYDKFDFIFCMEQRNVDSAKRIFGGDKDGKVMRLLDITDNPRNIADPWWTGDFDRAYADIVEGCELALDYVSRSAQ